MNRTIRSLVAATAATAALFLVPLTLTSTSSASAATTSASAVTYYDTHNWAGYYARTPGKQPLYEVTATFTVPDVSHQPVTGLANYDAALWAGIGGIDKGTALEQAGLFIRKQHRWSKPEYILFHQATALKGNMQPYLHKDGSLFTVKPGTEIAVQVSSPSWNGTSKWEFTIYINPNSLNPTVVPWAEALPASVNTGRTAEVITEWARGKAWGIAGLAGYASGMISTGNVKYTSADYLTQSGTKPEPVPVTQHPVALDIGWQSWFATIYPGSPASSYPQYTPTIHDSFYTYVNVKR
jgi:hypothetical protein